VYSAFLIIEGFGGPDPYDAFVKSNEMIKAGEAWRLITPMFLHGGLAHLALNSYSLFIVGPIVEIIYGHGRFLAIYLAAGIMGNVMSFAMTPQHSLGASGAIFGLMGATLVLMALDAGFRRQTFAVHMLAMLAINTAYGFTNPGIDNFAHLGGLAGGALVSAAVGMGGLARKAPGSVGKGGKASAIARSRPFKAAMVALALAMAVLGVWRGIERPPELWPDLSLGHLDEAYARFEANDFEGAIMHAEEAYARTEDDDGPIRDYAYDVICASNMNLGRYAQAVPFATALIQSGNPAFKSRGYYLRAMCYLNMEDHGRARNDAEVWMMTFGGGDREVDDYMGVRHRLMDVILSSYASEGMAEEGLAAAERFRQGDDDAYALALGYYYGALCRLALGDADGAREDLGMALGLMEGSGLGGWLAAAAEELAEAMG